MWLNDEFFEHPRVQSLCGASKDGALLAYIRLKIKAGPAGCLEGDVAELAELIQTDKAKLFCELYDLFCFGLLDQTPDGRIYFNL